MKRLVKVLMVLALGAIICLPGMALADTYLLSSGSGTGTFWSAPPGDASLAPYAGGVPSPFIFTSFETQFSDTNPFAGTGTVGYGGTFGADGWTATLLGPNTSLATGPAASMPATWDYLFAGTAADYPTTFDINYYDGTTFVGHEHYVITAYQTWDKTGTVSGFDMTEYAMVPIPPSALLLGSGLLGLVGVGWRRRKTDA